MPRLQFTTGAGFVLVVSKGCRPWYETSSTHSGLAEGSSYLMVKVATRVGLVDSARENENKRAKRWTALLFSSSKPKPSELQLRKGALLRRTPTPLPRTARRTDRRTGPAP